MKTHFDLKKILILSASTLAGTTYGQVGINTPTPNTIFDINAKRNPSGELTSNDQTFGLQAPRISREELTNNTANYGSNQNGALIYVTNISGGTNTGQREYMTSIGYYYFDAAANRWQKVMNGTGGTAYTAANGITMYGNQIRLGGALTEATTISNVSATNKLAITGTGTDAINFDSNTLSIDASNNRIGIGNTNPSERLDVTGNGKFSQKVTIGSNWTGTALAVENNVASEPIMALSGTGSSRRVTVLDNGNMGIGTQTPSEKLDVDGNARFRNVPSGNLSSTDDYLAISSNGTLKKVDVNLPALGLYAVTTGTSGHPSNGSTYDLNFENTIKRDGNFIATSTNKNTFIAVKDGLYTVEVWAQFSLVPQITNEGARGCSVLVTSSAGNNVQRIGDRWIEGGGTTGLNKTFILNANQNISIYTRCKRTNSPTYETGSNSTLLITYTPLQ